MQRIGLGASIGEDLLAGTWSLQQSGNQEHRTSNKAIQVTIGSLQLQGLRQGAEDCVRDREGQDLGQEGSKDREDYQELTWAKDNDQGRPGPLSGLGGARPGPGGL